MVRSLAKARRIHEQIVFAKDFLLDKATVKDKVNRNSDFLFSEQRSCELKLSHSL